MIQTVFLQHHSLLPMWPQLLRTFQPLQVHQLMQARHLMHLTPKNNVETANLPVKKASTIYHFISPHFSSSISILIVSFFYILGYIHLLCNAPNALTLFTMVKRGYTPAEVHSSLN
jgi:hypothetical protein